MTLTIRDQGWQLVLPATSGTPPAHFFLPGLVCTLMSTIESPRTQWVFTINNPTEKDREDVQLLPFRFLVFQLERGDSGTPHYQGAVVLKKKVRFKTLKKLVPRAHFEPMRGTPEQAAEYASKEEGRLEGPWRYGEPPRPGTRTDLMRVKKDMDEGMSLKELSEEHFSAFIRYGRGLKEYRLLHSEPRRWKTEVYYLWGPKNSGKSFMVHQRQNVFVKPHASWWTGYDDHTDVLFDEFTSTKYGKITELNQWFDKYPCTAPVHGGTVNINPRRIWITSNMHPTTLFPKVEQEKPELVKAFWSRVEWIYQFKEDRTYENIPTMFLAGDYWKCGFKRL